jgi:hypothetical protein
MVTGRLGGKSELNTVSILTSPLSIQTVQTIHIFHQGRGAGILNLAVVIQGQLANSGLVVLLLNYIRIYLLNVEL